VRCSPERLDAYVDGELDEAARREVQRHLAACKHCRSEVEALRALKAMLRESAPWLAPADVRRQVADIVGQVRFREAQRLRRQRRRRFVQGALLGGLIGTVAAAAVAAVAWLGGELPGRPSALASTVDAVVTEHSRQAWLLEAGVDDWPEWQWSWEWER